MDYTMNALVEDEAEKHLELTIYQARKIASSYIDEVAVA